MNTGKCLTVDFRRNPWRGILSDIAREQGVSPQAVSQGRRLRNPKILALIAAKVEERRQNEAAALATLEDTSRDGVAS